MGWKMPMSSHTGWRRVRTSDRRKIEPGLADGLHRKAPLCRGGKRSRVESGGWLVAERAAGLAQEDVVEAGSVQGDRLGGQALAIEDSQQLRDRDLATVDVEADESVLGRRLADERQTGHEAR